MPGKAAGNVWSLSCIVPPGQGSRATVSVVRTEGAASAEFFSTATVAYAAPVVTGYFVLNSGAPPPPPTDCGKYGCGAAALDAGFAAFTAATVSGGAGGVVQAPCAGNATMRIRGTNLGVAPVIVLADGYTISGAAIYPCTDGAQFAKSHDLDFAQVCAHKLTEVEPIFSSLAAAFHQQYSPLCFERVRVS